MLDQSNDNARLTAGQHLRREMKRRGFDQKRLAKEIGVSRQTINYIVNDRQEISIEVGHALSRLMGLPEDYWLNEGFSNKTEAASHSISQGPEFGFGPGVLVDAVIEQAVTRGAISIDPFRKENLKQASLDLTVGQFALLEDGEQVELTENKGFVLRSGDTITLHTEEKIALKNQMVCRVGGTTEFARQGVLVIHGFQIDPAYEGRLHFSVAYFGSDAFEVLAGQKLLSIEFTGLSRSPASGFNQHDPSFEELREERSLASTLHELLWTRLKDSVQVLPQNGRFSASIPGVLDVKSVFDTKEEAEDNLDAFFKSRLSSFTSGNRSSSLIKFVQGLTDETDACLLTHEDACRMFTDMGYKLSPDRTAIIGPNGNEVFLPGRNSSGAISVFHILEELGVV